MTNSEVKIMSFQTSDTVKQMEKNLNAYRRQTGTSQKKWSRGNIRENIYKIVDSDDDYNKASIIFDIIILAVILISLIPLIYPEGGFIIKIIEIATLIIFIFEYFLRFITSKFKYIDNVNYIISRLEVKKEDLIRQRSIELFQIKNIEDSINLLT